MAPDGLIVPAGHDAPRVLCSKTSDMTGRHGLKTAASPKGFAVAFIRHLGYDSTKSYRESVSKTMIIRREYHFTGIVQGVGFRYRARHAANGMGITGWIRNEWDGSVTMQAQGSGFQLDRLLEAVNGGDYIVIDGIESRDLPLEEHEYGFHVR